MEWVALHLVPKLTVAREARSSLPVPRPTLDLGFYSHVLRSDADRYYFFGFLAILGIVFAENLFRTRIGRAWIAIRENELAAESIGISLFSYKLMAFALSAFYAGVAGALVAYNLRAVTHEAFGVDLTIQYLTMIIIGGLGSLPGCLLGAAFVVLLPTVIRDQLVTPAKDAIPRIAEYYAFVQQAMFGLLIIFFIILEPDGIYRIWIRVRNAIKRWPFSY